MLPFATYACSGRASTMPRSSARAWVASPRPENSRPIQRAHWRRRNRGAPPETATDPKPRASNDSRVTPEYRPRAVSCDQELLMPRCDDAKIGCRLVDWFAGVDGGCGWRPFPTSVVQRVSSTRGQGMGRHHNQGRHWAPNRSLHLRFMPASRPLAEGAPRRPNREAVHGLEVHRLEWRMQEQEGAMRDRRLARP